MTDRDELVEAARNAADSDLYSPSLLLRILDAVEPIIRADEREQIATESLAWVAARTAEQIAQAIEARVAHLLPGMTGTADAYEDAAIARRIGGVQ
jgi:hypothetical protein